MKIWLTWMNSIKKRNWKTYELILLGLSIIVLPYAFILGMGVLINLGVLTSRSSIYIVMIAVLLLVLLAGINVVVWKAKRADKSITGSRVKNAAE